MPPRGISANFYRGGTSRGLLFRAETLAAYPPAVRDRIILTALGSPDPAGRQISGLGGGVSSLSKAAIIGVPSEGKEAQEAFGALPGVRWADEGRRDGLGEWDVVYRFAQVGVKEPVLDWSASCGNMFAAVALAAVSNPIIPYTTLFSRSRTLPRPNFGSPLLFPLSILSASNGVLMRARVPIDPYSLQPWEPGPGEGVEIAGVPGADEPGIEVEMPLETGGGNAQGGLVTGMPKDVVKLDNGTEITLSILTAGLPNIFVPLSSLLSLPAHSFPPSLITLPAATLTNHNVLPSLLEEIRTTAARQFDIPLSLASPKVVLVNNVPSGGYASTAGTRVEKKDADLLVRAVSSGDFHATIPGTTLAAVNLGAGTPGTVIHDLTSGPSSTSTGGAQDEVVTVRAGHAAGVANSSVRFVGGKAQSVVMVRTAREIMKGEVMVPERVFMEGQAA
ncbi:hypothetical protein JCM8547_005108 [Rhodosporidiobolus lusitaniae]